jgi:hypothetical protein
MECLYCKGTMIKSTAPFSAIEMAIISLGILYRHGYVLNVANLSLKLKK